MMELKKAAFWKSDKKENWYFKNMKEFLTIGAKNIPFELTEIIKERDFI